MRLELVEVSTNKKNIYIYVIIAIIIIAFLMFSIYIYTRYIAKLNNEEIPFKQEVLGVFEERPRIKKTTKTIPIYTLEAKERIGSIYKSETKRVFLTFDDGPSYTVTPLILDLLKANDIKASFFVLGSRVDLYPQILKRIYEEGHYIANHGYSHVYSKIYKTPETVIEEYEQCEYSIRMALGIDEYQSYLFRFPGGSIGGKYSKLKSDAKKLLDERQIGYVDWNCLTEDSNGNVAKENLMQSLINTSQGKNSIVILMHDAGDKILTYEILQEAIDYLKLEGYEFYSFYDIMDKEEIPI